MTWKVKDGGSRTAFITGSVREASRGKPRFDLISVHGLLRLATAMAKGAEKYGERNWEKGQPVSRFYESALRHIFQWAMGDNSEDHLAACVFNIFGIIETQERVQRGQLPVELDDMFGNVVAQLRRMRTSIYTILIDQYTASITQVKVAKYMSEEAIKETLLLTYTKEEILLHFPSALASLLDQSIIIHAEGGYAIP